MTILYSTAIRVELYDTCILNGLIKLAWLIDWLIDWLWRGCCHLSAFRAWISFSQVEFSSDSRDIRVFFFSLRSTWPRGLCLVNLPHPWGKFSTLLNPFYNPPGWPGVLPLGQAGDMCITCQTTGRCIHIHIYWLQKSSLDPSSISKGMFPFYGSWVIRSTLQLRCSDKKLWYLPVIAEETEKILSSAVIHMQEVSRR